MKKTVYSKKLLALLVGGMALVLLLASCSRPDPQSVLAEYKAAAEKVAAAINSDNLDASRAALTEYIAVANSLARVRDLFNEDQAAELAALTEATELKIIPAKAKGLLAQMRTKLEEWKKLVNGGEDPEVLQLELNGLVFDLSTLEAGLSSAQLSEYQDLSGQFAKLDAQRTVRQQLSELARELERYKGVVQDNNAEELLNDGLFIQDIILALDAAEPDMDELQKTEYLKLKSSSEAQVAMSQVLP